VILLTLASSLPAGFRGVFYLASWASLWFFPHCITHFIIGRLVGIRFRNYFLGQTHLVKVLPPRLRPLLARMPVLGIRVEKTSLEAARPRARYAMFASGAMASMLLPFLVPLYLLLVGETSAAGILLVISLANLLFTAALSPRVGDLYKARRSR
jgi:hypothetical protein